LGFHKRLRAVKQRRLGRPLLAQTVAAELQAMGVVNDAIEDGVGVGGITEHRRMPQLLIG
jgi:hypothetical protein